MTSGFVGLHDDDRLRLDDLGLDLLLLVGLQRALLLRLLPHPLDGVHDVGLLVEEGVPEVRRPLDVVTEPLDDVGQRRHRLDGRVPGLLGDRVHERLVLQVLVLREPLLELHELERVRGRDERLGKERVGVEGDRRHQRIELVRRELRRSRRGRLGGRRRRRLREEQALAGDEERGAEERQKGCERVDPDAGVGTKSESWPLLISRDPPRPIPATCTTRRDPP